MTYPATRIVDKSCFCSLYLITCVSAQLKYAFRNLGYSGGTDWMATRIYSPAGIKGHLASYGRTTFLNEFGNITGRSKAEISIVN